VRFISLLFSLLAGLSCGYHPLYAERPTVLSVVAGELLVPEFNATQAALSGAKSELAAARRLAEGGGFPRLVIDLLRVDEVSRGIHVQGGLPVAGSMSIAVVVRGRVLAGPDQDAELDTGDLRRASQTAGSSNVRADSVAYDNAIRSAAERAGRAAARAVLGIPEPSDEPP
jgi:hypothetical protein